VLNLRINHPTQSHLKMLQTKTLPIFGARALALLLPAFCLATVVMAQPGVSYTTVTDESGVYRNFSDASIWGGTAPSDGANVTISNCLVTMDTDMTLGTITILSSGRLQLGSSTLTITSIAEQRRWRYFG